VEQGHQQTSRLRRARLSTPFGLKVGNDLMLGRFLEINALVAQLDTGKRGLEDPNCQLDLSRGNGVEWV
jgi:hypothetical protein